MIDVPKGKNIEVKTVYKYIIKRDSDPKFISKMLRRLQSVGGQELARSLFALLLFDAYSSSTS